MAGPYIITGILIAPVTQGVFVILLGVQCVALIRRMAALMISAQVAPLAINIVPGMIVDHPQFGLMKVQRVPPMRSQAPPAYSACGSWMIE